MKSPTPDQRPSGFTTRFAPLEEDIYKCVQCGFCLNACPTYLETGLEAESPRGRLTLMKAVNEGRLEMTDEVVRHWDLCLQCRACEVACPSGVPYGKAMISLRAEMAERVKRPAKLRVARRVGLRRILAKPGLMRAVGRTVRAYQRSPLRRFVKKRRARSGNGLQGSTDDALPVMASDFFMADGSITYPAGQIKGRVSMLAGCVMTMMHPGTLRAAVRVLAHNGYEVHVPSDQGCCGSLNLHGGERETAQSMVARNAESLLSPDPDAVVTVSAGCGSTMKEYEELVPQVTGAEQLAHKTRDIHELLMGGDVKPPTASMPVRVTYQDPCHLLSTQRIADPPRQLLRLIDGVDLIDLPEPNICCGSAGTYSIQQREMSERIGNRKARNIISTRANVLATANPGCASQITTALGRLGNPDIEVRYVVDLLDAAYRKGGDYDHTVYAGAGRLASD